MNHRGMALPIVFTIIGLLSITAIMLLKANRQDLPQSFHNLKHTQMKYIAKGALQHARLKMKILSTEAYDAAAYSVGKNPYYDHSGDQPYPAYMVGNPTRVLGPNDPSAAPNGIVINPGPAFLTGTVSIDGGNLIREQVDHICNTANAQEWGTGDVDGTAQLWRPPGEPDSRPLKRVNLALVRFWEDISTLDIYSTSFVPIHEHSQPAVGIVKGRREPVTGIEDTFSASYRVTDMRVLAGRGGRLYGEEAVAVNVLVQMKTMGFLANETEADDTGLAEAQQQRLGNAAIYSNVEGELRESAVFKVARTLN
jgi:hypothetical protein